MTPGNITIEPCGCCEGIEEVTPVEIFNQAGLPALAYRVGTHASFKESLLATLSRFDALRDLSTREDDDPSIALLDGWATVLDVLTFYQERIANEGFLRTAQERRSLLELGRLIGYRLRPGVAASTVLAFTMLDAQGAPRRTNIPAGTKVQSIPGPNELPQFFELTGGIEARVEWNTLRPRQFQPQILFINEKANQLQFNATNGGLSADFSKTPLNAPLVYLYGAASVKAGDFVLIAPNDPAVNSSNSTTLVLTAKKVVFEAKENRTRVEFEEKVDPDNISFPELPEFYLAPGNKPPFTTNYPGFKPLPLTSDNIDHYVVQALWRERDLSSFLSFNNWSAEDVLKYINQPVPPGKVFGVENIFTFKERAGFFGHNAPRHSTLPKATGGGDLYTPDWDSTPWPIWIDPNSERRTSRVPVEAANIAATTGIILPDTAKEKTAKFKETVISPYTSNSYWASSYGVDVFLERSMAGIVSKSWAIITQPQGVNKFMIQPYWVELVRDSSLAAFALSGKATGLGLNPLKNNPNFLVRRSTAHVQSEVQPLAMLPVTESLKSKNIMLDRMVLGLTPGQPLVLTGELSSTPGVVHTEILTLEDAVHFGGFTTLNLLTAPAESYIRNTVTLNANVAPASHGETRREVLGSGDASKPFQVFSLKQKPLTYLADTSPGGAASTLQIRVNDVLWSEVPSLFDLGPRDRVFVTRQEEDGKVKVEFGDGIHGARIPSGVDNVVAQYRVGLGESGLLQPDQLSLLVNRPLGVQGVSNPLGPTGGQNPEKLEDARQNTPLVVQTMDRIVSLQDFENFARSFAGIAKAQACWLWEGGRRVVHLTIAGARGTRIDPAANLFRKLSAAIDLARESSQPVKIESFEPVYFSLQAKILVNPRYLPDKVSKAAADVLLYKYSFEQQSLGRPVTPSEIIVTIQEVEGVDAVELDDLHKIDFFTPSNEAVRTLYPEEGKPKPAQMLLLNSDGLKILEKLL